MGRSTADISSLRDDRERNAILATPVGTVCFVLMAVFVDDRLEVDTKGGNIRATSATFLSEKGGCQADFDVQGPAMDLVEPAADSGWSSGD